MEPLTEDDREMLDLVAQTTVRQGKQPPHRVLSNGLLMEGTQPARTLQRLRAMGLITLIRSSVSGGAVPGTGLLWCVWRTTERGEAARGGA